MTDRQYFFRTFRYLKPYKVSYAIGTFLYCVQTFAFPLMSSIFIGGVTTAVVNFHFPGVLDAIWVMVAMMLGFSITIGIGTYFYVVSTVQALRDLSIHLYGALMKTGTESQRHSGEGVAAINTDINTANDIFSNGITSFLRDAISISFSLVAVLVIDWRMGLVVTAVGALAFFVQSRFAPLLAKLGKERLETNAESVKSLSNIIAGALTIRAYNRQDRALFQFDKENGQLKKIAFRQAFIGMWQDLFTTVQGWMTMVTVFALGGWLVATGSIEFAIIMMVMPFASVIGGSMSSIGTNFAALQPPIVAAKRIFAIIDSAENSAQAEMKSSNDLTGHDSNTDSAPVPQDTINYCITLNNISFLYKDAVDEALKDISISIAENKMIAFVGASGSGKSTLLRTVIGMYERECIDMEIGGMPFTSKNIDSWRSRFAYVDQSCKLFDMSIKENILMGRQGETDDEQAYEAAKRAFAHDFITELPEGYDTACGEKGASLSGGQKQRIAIARALYRKAPVLVFDEATSALDAESERSIMETIENLRNDHTILITTHNLGNIVGADLIVVMDQGRIAETGTHTELMEKDSLYSRLQAGR